MVGFPSDPAEVLHCPASLDAAQHLPAPPLTCREAGRTSLIVSTRQQGHSHPQGQWAGAGAVGRCYHPTFVFIPTTPSFSDEHPSHTKKKVRGLSVGLRKIKCPSSWPWHLLSLSKHLVGVQEAIQWRTRVGGWPEEPTVQANRTTEVRRLLGNPAPESYRIGPDFRSRLPVGFCQQSK